MQINYFNIGKNLSKSQKFQLKCFATDLKREI